MHGNVFEPRRWWTRGGDVETLDTKDDLEAAVLYLLAAQDRKRREQ